MINTMDDDVPQLSAETFNILQQFYAEQAEKEQILLQNASDKNGTEFQENWQLSQFWYDDDTITKLVNIIMSSVEPGSSIALVSCPSLYTELKRQSSSKSLQVTLLEYDKRFAVHEGFLYYDYNSPLDLPGDMEKSFDLVICDPPFLSEECLSKTALTVKFLAKDKIILCSGAIMEDVAREALGVKKSSFVPHHRNNLANEFCCYTNFDFCEF